MVSARRHPPRSAVVLSEDELAIRLREKGGDETTVNDALAEMRKAQAERQAEYDAGTLSRNDVAVRTEADKLREELRREAKEAARETPVTDPQDAVDARMREMGEQAHDGTRWADMPVLHLLNASRKQGNADMAAYAEWKRTHRDG